jgi:hypothetical protein
MKSNAHFTFAPDRNLYVIQFRKRLFPWWILLFLLLFLIFFIPVSDTVRFEISEKNTEQALPGATVLLNRTDFETNEIKTESKTTNDQGQASFEVNRRLLFHYLFSDEKYSTRTFAARAEKQEYKPDSILSFTVGELRKNKESVHLHPEAIQKAVVPDEPQKPKEGCRAFFTGLVVGGQFLDTHISQVYKEDQYSEYVGAGEYPDNEKTFPKAVATTFDGIAIDSGTRVIIYEEKDFKGKVLLDKTGPAIINNIKWRDDSRYSHCNTDTYPEPLQSNFPQSVREWSKTDMQKWSFGSLKVICN